MAYSITESLNQLNDWGFFSYVVPFMLLFAVVFGILQKTEIFGKGDKAKGVNAIIAAGVGLLALLNDTVATFFSTIFPRFGVGLAIFLVLIIALGFFLMGDNGAGKDKLQWIGWVVGIGVVVWAIDDWSHYWGSGIGSFGFWIEEYLPAVLILAAVVWAIYAIVGGSSSGGKPVKPGV